MNFDFSDDQKLLQQTVQEYLNDHAPLATARRVMETGASYSEELWRGAGAMGWLGAAVPEEYGGSGFGYLELALIAQEMGRVLAPVPFSSSVYLATEAILLAGTAEQKQRYLPRLAAGERIGTLALDERAGCGGAERIGTTFADGRLNGTKVPVPDGDVADLIVVVARDAARGDIGLVLVDGSAAGVRRTRLRAIDPTRSHAHLALTDVAAEPLGVRTDGWELVEHIRDRAAVLMAFEQIGGAQRAFDLTREFCLGRYAFGRQIASFQAIKHRLADLYVEIELARSNAYYGAWALSHDHEELAVAACAARASASDAFELASKEMVQLHGGVGFTWEYDCHLFYRRAKLLGLALGTAAEWRDRLIRRLAPGPAEAARTASEKA